MIPVPTGVRRWLATGYTVCAEAFRRWHSKCRRCCAKTRSVVICSSSAVAADNKRQFSFCGDRVSVATAVQANPAGIAVHGKDLTCIYTDERPDLCRELPNWMFDEGYCAGMTLGQPEISIEGLNEFAAVLASLSERIGSEEHNPVLPSRRRRVVQRSLWSARFRARKSQSSSASGAKHGRTGRGLGGPPAGSPEGGGIGDEGGGDEQQGHL